MADKLKIGIYWAASCGGCEIGILEIGDKLLTLLEVADLVFCPCILDFKYDDVRAMPDGAIDVCLFNGGIRNSENQEIAELLRRKSKVMVAFGSCACEGGIPSLGNLFDCAELLQRAYTTESTDNPKGIIPGPGHSVAEGELHLPTVKSRVKRLCDVVDVDYFMPGCPPHEKMVWAVVEAIASGKLPPKGSKVGVGNKSVCDECRRERRGVKIKAFKRPHEIIPEDGWCLLEQGILCMGSATRSGCEARCLDANMPCRGCYGPAGEARDQGAAMLSAVGSMLEADSIEGAERIVKTLVDPAGTTYRFGMAESMLVRHLPEKGPR
jgi:F420-non-reducing hydrogenase small subunit